MMKNNTLAMAVAGFVLFASAGQAAAGDYYNACKTADQRFEIHDETLYAKSDPQQKSIHYETLDKTTTAERRGYCVAKGKRYPFEGRDSTLRIRFDYLGSTIETIATCEFATSGLPAAYNCEREVVTFDSNADSGSGSGSAQSCGEGTLWNHNGSQMRLIAKGYERRIVYERPRQSLLSAGVNPCDVVFEGEKQGKSYVGTAYVFSERCGPYGYPVSGPVSADGLKVTLYGKAPRRRDDCSVKGYRDDKLDFKYLKSR